mmetsp:Transcript_10037/g.27402  ORF Transcript_10037/g.27402 Transcript_10037/m.27402 type:complete len:221 (+) Transcript_10037:9377-10039(+)
MRQSLMVVSQYERSWHTHWKQSTLSALDSITPCTISRLCASMVIIFMIFWRLSFLRSVRVTSISFLSCSIWNSLYLTMALLSPLPMLMNACSTSWHQKIWFTTRMIWEGQSNSHSWRGLVGYALTESLRMLRSSLRIFKMTSLRYSSTLFSKAMGVLNCTYSTPTEDTMPRDLGRMPGGGLSLSSFSLSIAWKHLDMCIITRTGLLPLDRISSKSAVDTK